MSAPHPAQDQGSTAPSAYAAPSRSVPGGQLAVGAALADAVLAAGDVVGGLADLDRPDVEGRPGGKVGVRLVAALGEAELTFLPVGARDPDAERDVRVEPADVEDEPPGARRDHRRGRRPPWGCGGARRPRRRVRSLPVTADQRCTRGSTSGSSPVSGRATVPTEPTNALTTVLVTGATTTPGATAARRAGSTTVAGSCTWVLGETRASSGTRFAAWSCADRAVDADQAPARKAVASAAARKPAVTLGSSGRRRASRTVRRSGGPPWTARVSRASAATAGLHSRAPSRPVARVSPTSAATGSGAPASVVGRTRASTARPPASSTTAASTPRSVPGRTGGTGGEQDAAQHRGDGQAQDDRPRRGQRPDRGAAGVGHHAAGEQQHHREAGDRPDDEPEQDGAGRLQGRHAEHLRGSGAAAGEQRAVLALGGAPGRGQHEAEAELQRAGADAEHGEPAAGAPRPGRRVEDDGVRPDEVERAGHEVHLLGDRVERAGEGVGPAGGDDVGVERGEPREVAAVRGQRREVGHRRRRRPRAAAAARRPPGRGRPGGARAASRSR